MRRRQRGLDLPKVIVAAPIGLPWCGTLVRYASAGLRRRGSSHGTLCGCTSSGRTQSHSSLLFAVAMCRRIALSASASIGPTGVLLLLLLLLLLAGSMVPVHHPRSRKRWFGACCRCRARTRVVR